jgi:glucose/mannose-6-phosphate isomerase
MNLDDATAFATIDPQNMLAQIDGLPAQLRTAWELGRRLPLPEFTLLRQVLIAGMGGSAIGADLLAAYAAAQCRIPIFVHRDYDLPAWAAGPETLVIASSHSGNTEETLSSFEAARRNGCQMLVVATGGKLVQAAAAADVPAWIFEHRGQPRAAVGFSFGLLLAALARLGLLPDPAAELASAIHTMQEQREALRAAVPTAQNPAKRLAGQAVGRWVTVFGAGILAPVARRWKGQISELAKAWAQFEFLPEADHNTLAGTLNPEELLARSMVIFLRSPSDHPRNRLRSDLTRRAMMLEGLNTDAFEAPGDTPLAHLWSSLLFGDYVAYYLAMAYGVDPTPIAALENFKREMSAARE